jgi:hypothetical protein
LLNVFLRYVKQRITRLRRDERFQQQKTITMEAVDLACGEQSIHDQIPALFFLF